MKTALCLIAAFAMTVTGSSVAAASVVTDCQQLSSEQSQALDRAAGFGDTRAATCLALGLRSMGGGELEDALVALGRYGDHRPVSVLALTHRGTLSRRSLADAVSMLPLSFADDIGRQKQALESRRNRFRNVSQSQFSAERDLALRSVDAALAELGPALDR